uniref:CSON006810 protein n=1 Tax=Culicoides sonorensis TaxID=179676 RepID=A0A336M8U6_CULSO
MSQVICLIFMVVIATSMARSISLDDEDNSVNPLVATQQKIESRNDFVKIVKSPPARVAQPLDSTIELECEVVGSPIPIVQWVTGSGQYVNFDDFETNLISESDPTIMTTVRARLVIDHQIGTERTYTCVARAGGKTVYASTTVHKGPRHLTKQLNLPDLLVSKKRPVRITHYFKNVLALMGSNLILPCKTNGRPRAEITWLDVDDNVITGQETRFKTLPTGELIISDLKWSDMGSYTCVAKNGFSKDTISTFIYPTKDE